MGKFFLRFLLILFITDFFDLRFFTLLLLDKLGDIKYFFIDELLKEGHKICFIVVSR